MTLQEVIRQIRAGLTERKYPSEATISHGVVKRILNSLGWDTFDTEVVWPEYSLSGYKVDYAMCHPRRKPIVFIEVKQQGKIEGADRQLFKYAFDEGIPMGVLTDGQEWHFYLPGEQGRYDERRVYKLDLLERDEAECESRFRRYLDYQAICSGKALEEARKDYQSLTKGRQIKQALPVAWTKLVEEPDELLVELLADKVESLCGYKPSHDDVSHFLTERSNASSTMLAEPGRIETVTKTSNHITVTAPQPQQNGGMGFYLFGRFFPARNAHARTVMIDFFEELTRRDPTFIERFAAREHGTRRRYIAHTKEELYPGRPDLVQHSYELSNGWWIGVNYSRETMEKIIMLACEVAGLRYGTDGKAILN